MGAYKYKRPRPRVFNPLDLETIDLVYQAAWAQIIARDPSHDVNKEPERKELLRKKIFAVACPGAVDFDTLLDKVLWFSPEMWLPSQKPSGAPSQSRAAPARSVRSC